jgi:hypothetical protein
VGQPLRACDTPALALALANGSISQFTGLSRADLFTFTLADGVTTYRWTTWPSDITDMFGNTFSSKDQYLRRTRWSVTKTMVVPEMDVTLLSLNGSFDGGASIKAQIRSGLFHAASFSLKELYMPTPGDVTTLGGMELFGGQVGPITVTGAAARLTIWGRNAQLDQYAPRNVYQTSCVLSFCDHDCTLAKAAFTFPFTVGSSPAPSSVFIPWASAPGNPTDYIGGDVTITSGIASGQVRDVLDADSSGLTLDSSLDIVPAPGDTFDAFQGCDFTKASGSGRSCTDRSNQQHLLAFPFLPPPSAAY